MRRNITALLPAAALALCPLWSWAGDAPVRPLPKPPAPRPQDESPPIATDAGFLEAKQWARAWPAVSHHYIAWNGAFYAFPDYDSDYPSSALVDGARLSTADYVGKKFLMEKQLGNRDGVPDIVRKDDEEAFAGTALLPSARAGAYGWIRSGSVGEIANASEAVLGGIRLVNESEIEKDKGALTQKIDAKIALADRALQKAAEERVPWHLSETDRKQAAQKKEETIRHAQAAKKQAESLHGIKDWFFAERTKAVARQEAPSFAQADWHVVGFKTEKMRVDAAWPASGKGVQLAILKSSENGVYAAPAALLERGLTEAEVAELLKSRGVSRKEFLGLVAEGLRRFETMNTASVWVTAELERRRPGTPAAPPAHTQPQPPPKAPANDVELVK